MISPGRHVPSDHSPSRNDGARATGTNRRTDGNTPHPARWQFGLPALLGTMLLLCLPFAIWGAILRANEDEQLVWMLLCVAAPVGVLVVAALLFSLGRFLGSLRRAREKEADDLPDRQPDE